MSDGFTEKPFPAERYIQVTAKPALEKQRER